MRELSGYSTSGLTDYTYTGQRTLDPGMGGLMDYKARFYSHVLGRFIQPDTLIPNASNPQAWNRFSYVANRPINFNDPTGHISCDDTDKNGKCINYELNNKRLQNKLKGFSPPDKVEEDDLILIGNFLFGFVELTPGEYEVLGGNPKGYPRPISIVTVNKMREIYLNSLSTTNILFPQSPDWLNDPSDAFRHAYWNALLTREFGVDFAKSFTTAHETNPSSEREEAFMDLHNNEVGRNIGTNNPNASDQELQAIVLESLYNGELYVWDGKNMYFSDQCLDCWWRAE